MWKRLLHRSWRSRCTRTLLVHYRGTPGDRPAGIYNVTGCIYAFPWELVELELIILPMRMLQNYLLFHLQLLIFKLAFQFFRFCNFPHCLVEVVLVYRVPIIFDSEESPTEID